MDEKITMLRVDGIHCEGCAGNVEQAIRSVQGVKEINVDIEHGKVSVRYDADSTNQDHLRNAIRKIGYRVA